MVSFVPRLAVGCANVLIICDCSRLSHRLRSSAGFVQIHFTLEVGKQFGGALVVKPIMLWLDPFLRNTLTDLFVWPNRIVVPLSPDPNFDYSALEMQCASCTPPTATVIDVMLHVLRSHGIALPYHRPVLLPHEHCLCLAHERQTLFGISPGS